MFWFDHQVGTALNPESQCVPFVSQFTDCTEENRCSGCTNCLCTRDGRWSCKPVVKCGAGGSDTGLDGRALDDALETLLDALKPKNGHMRPKPYAHKLMSTNTKYDEDDDEGVLEETEDLEKEVISMLARRKRAVNSNVKLPDKVGNGTVKFYHTVDEVNEDYLKNNKTTGTIEAQKFDPNNIAKLSRRSGQIHDDNSSALHIEYNDHTSYNPHETDNKIDSNSSQNNADKVSNADNFKDKDKDLSKLVVNELKKGIEYIGDKHAPVTSNITFTPEKDTLTAMAFIAGNLLNKLWSIEKDNGEDPIETEILKHEKISDLIALFKEPLTMRQAMFLKNALEKISKTIDNDDGDNTTLCKKLESARQEAYEPGCDQRKMIVPSQKSATEDAVSKIGDVLKLVKKFETVNVELDKLKDPKSSTEPKTILRSGDEDKEVNQFGNILEKITKLLMPDKKQRKDTLKKIQNQKTVPEEPIKNKLKELFNMEPESLNISPKDELLFSYLQKMEKSPKCLLDIDSKIEPSNKPVGGDILLNLSEFFKVKSLVDLLKLVDNKPVVTTTEQPVTSSRREYIKPSEILTDPNSKDLEQTKNKLKGHLKSILEDIAELQNARGANKDTNYKISDILPCVYKLLKDSPVLDKTSPKVVKKGEVTENLRKLFDSIKQNGKLLEGTRKFNIEDSPRPKSAIVWERTVATLEEINKQPTRRHLELDEPKRFDELKTLMAVFKSLTPNSTKDDAVKEAVPPSERLVLYKTLEGDAKHNIKMLKLIQDSLNSQTLSKYQIRELRSFIDDAFMNLESTVRVLEHIDDPAQAIKPQLVKKQPIKMPSKSIKTTNRDDKVKVTRDQLLNQLIKNRIETYLKTKEALNSIGDKNYKVAQRIRRLIQNGSYSLARQLFKLFAKSTKVMPSTESHLDSLNTRSRLRNPSSKPVQDSQKTESALDAQEYLLQQLLNLQDMKSI